MTPRVCSTLCTVADSEALSARAAGGPRAAARWRCARGPWVGAAWDESIHSTRSWPHPKCVRCDGERMKRKVRATTITRIGLERHPHVMVL